MMILYIEMVLVLRLKIESGSRWLVKILKAKQIIQSEPPDLIISDCLLYDETVIDLLHWMKMQNIAIPVIAVSASDDESLPDKVIKCGARNFYDKLDFNLSKIYEELERWKV